jgi:hypothetical protein
VIKFIGNGKQGRKVLGLGLSRKNTERLLKGEPIHINREDLDFLVSMHIDEVIIFAGETEDTMQEDFKKAGFLETTKIIRRGGSH